MTGTLTALAQSEPESEPHAGAPMLPVEGYVVAATRALEAMKSQADMALALLQYTPRNGAALFESLAIVRARADDANDAYRAYFEILHCKGQA